MISVKEEKNIVARAIPVGGIVKIPLPNGTGRMLAADLFSPINSPSFSSSAMDGYAVYHGDTPGELPVKQTVAAGDLSPRPLKRGEAFRIMTGALIPAGVTAVVPQEEVESRKDNKIFIPHPVVERKHIRWEGEELKKGDVALPKGTLLTPGGIGFLASLGI